MRSVRSVWVVCLVWLCARSVSASPLQDLVGDTASLAGQQARTVAGGSGAAYFNPALLTEGPTTAKIGFFILSQDIGIHLDGRPGTQFAIPEGVENFGHTGGARFDNYPIATDLLQFGRMKDARRDTFTARPRQGAGSGHGVLTYETAGFVLKLFDDLLGLGFHAMIPNGEFTKMRAFFNDEREQYFSNSLHPELYSDRMTALTIALGLGIKISDALSIGLGTTFALKAGVGAGAYVADTGNLGKIQLDIDASVNIGIAPHFGVSFKPNKRWHLTATAHTPQRVELESSFKFLLANGIEQQSGLKFVLDYTPWQVGGGVSYDLIQDETQTLTLAGTALYAAWSSYIDRHGEAPTSGYPWADTISPTLGLRYALQKFHALFDLTYAPTPVPEQSGRTNYVDNNRVTGSLGVEYRFTMLRTDVAVGLQLQVHRLVSRYQYKLRTPTVPDGTNIAPERVKDEVPDDAQKSGDPVPGAQGLQTNNPGWPGFASAGWITGAALYLSIAL